MEQTGTLMILDAWKTRAGYERDLAALFFRIMSIRESWWSSSGQEDFGNSDPTTLLNWPRNDCHLLFGIIYHWRQYCTNGTSQYSLGTFDVHISHIGGYQSSLEIDPTFVL